MTRSSTRGAGGTDEPCGKVLINELAKSGKFLLGQGVDRTKRWNGAFIQSDFEIVFVLGKFGLVWSQAIFAGPETGQSVPR